MIKSSFELKTIGSLLKERRKERELTIRQISELTKIREKYLLALENSDFNAFPSEVYIKGFLKNYAKFLGVSENRALALYRREREHRDKEPTISITERIKDSTVDLQLTPTKILVGTILVAILFVILYISSYITKIFQSPELVLNEPVAIAAGNEGIFETESDSLKIAGNIQVGSVLLINGQRLDTNNFEQFSTNLNLKEGLNVFIINAESQFGRKSELKLNVIKKNTATPASTITPTPDNSEITIQMEVINREAYVELLVDGESVLAGTQAAGEIFEFSANSSVEFFTPRPDAIKLKLNNEEQIINNNRRYIWNLENGELVAN